MIEFRNPYAAIRRGDAQGIQVTKSTIVPVILRYPIS